MEEVDKELEGGSPAEAVSESAAEAAPAPVPEEAAAESPSEAAEEARTEAPAEDAPSEDAPTEPAAESAPEEAGNDAPSTEDAPREDAPTEAAAESAPVEPTAESAPAGEASAEDAPTDAAPDTAAGGETPVTVEELLPEEAAAPASLEDAQLKAVLEAIVYVAEEPLTLAQLASALSQPTQRIAAMLAELIAGFDKPDRGITIREVAGGYKMATKPEHHESVRNFVKSLKPPLKLSLPALETLAVIAYKQPVTGPEIMEIRGVQGAGVLKTLLDRKLIAVAGRKNVIGKPMLYKTTREFLIQFGLKDMAELPSLKEFEEIRRMAFADAEPVPAPATAADPEAPAAEAAAPQVESEAPTPEAAAPEAPADAAPEAPPTEQEP